MLDLIVVALAMSGFGETKTVRPFSAESDVCTVDKSIFRLGNPSEDRITNSIAIRRDGVMYWNETGLFDETVPRYFKLIGQMRPQPQTILLWEAGVDCSQVDHIVVHAKAAGICDDDNCFQRGNLAYLPSGNFGD